MAKMIIGKTARAVWILVSVLLILAIHCTDFKFADYFVLDIILNTKQSEGNVNLFWHKFSISQV